MNHLILKYGRPLTAVILAAFAWVIYRRIASGEEIIPLAIAAVIVWGLDAPAFIYLWPRLTVNGYKRAIVKHGFGDGPIPVNTPCPTPLPRRRGAGALWQPGLTICSTSVAGLI